MIYKLTMSTQNPSADKTGYFETKEEVEKTIKKWESITDKDKDYYGLTAFFIKEIETGENYFD